MKDCHHHHFEIYLRDLYLVGKNFDPNELSENAVSLSKNLVLILVLYLFHV